jgi:hypothetical protein
MEAMKLKLAEAEARLRDALMAGAHTSALRQAISTIRLEIERGAAHAAEAVAEAEAVTAAAVQDRAKLIAKAAMDRISQRLESLQAPAHP